MTIIRKIILFPMWLVWLSFLGMKQYMTGFSLEAFAEEETPLIEWIQAIVIWILILVPIGGLIYEILIHS